MNNGIFYLLTSYTDDCYKHRKLLKRIHDLTKDIPRDYISPSRKIPAIIGSKRRKCSKPIEKYESLIRRKKKYKNWLKCSWSGVFPKEYVDLYFQNLDLALEHASMHFDHECGYYTWIKIHRNIFHDSDEVMDDKDFRVLNHRMVDTKEIWFKFNKESGKYEKTEEVPDFMKVVYY